MLSRDEILAADDLKVTAVAVPEWKGEVYIRRLNLTDRDELGERSQGVSTAEAVQNLVAIALCDAEGNRLFTTDAEIAAFKAKKGARAMMRLSKAVNKLNAITPEEEEELVKNGDAAPSDATASTSPNASA